MGIQLKQYFWLVTSEYVALFPAPSKLILLADEKECLTLSLT
jgi:hypothetical protein